MPPSPWHHMKIFIWFYRWLTDVLRNGLIVEQAFAYSLIDRVFGCFFAASPFSQRLIRYPKWLMDSFCFFSSTSLISTCREKFINRHEINPIARIFVLSLHLFPPNTRFGSHNSRRKGYCLSVIAHTYMHTAVLVQLMSLTNCEASINKFELYNFLTHRICT